jgi:thiamine phosphate synthase YjbQ (UPF0047 family)
MAEINKQMAEDNLKFQQNFQSSVRDITVQIEQIVSTVHQIQENKMLHNDVHPTALLEVIQCDTCLDETPGEPIKTLFASSDEHKIT